MNIAKFRAATIWVVAALALVAVSVAGQMIGTTGEAEAFQPEGLSILHDTPSEPPCPYGHDDACENGRPFTSGSPYQSSDPHEPAFYPGANHHHVEHLADIAHLNEHVLARLDRASRGPAPRDGEEGDGENGVSYAITSDILGLPWVTDGQTEAEKLTMAWLGELQEHNPALVTSLVRMPFLQDHTPGDLQAIQTLTLISVGFAGIDPDPLYARNLAAHIGFADGGGIDNTEAKIISVTSIPYDTGSHGLIDLLATYGTVEESSASGLYGNTLNFAVVRLLTVNHNSELMASAVSATRHAETLMGNALPVDFMGILVADGPGFLGANNSIHIQVVSGFDDGTYSDRTRQRTVAHEIGHYWWGTGDYYLHEDWISEGAAEYIGAYSVKTQFDESNLYLSNYPCPYYRTIEHLRADNPHYTFSNGTFCNYSLGEELFINLDRSMGHASFVTSFRNLHQRLSTYEDDEIDQGMSLMGAFCSQCLVSKTVSGGAGHTLARRYGEKILTDNSAPTGAVPGLGQASTVSLRDDRRDILQFGVPEISASSPDQRRWVMLFFRNVFSPPETVRVAVVQFHEHRYAYYSLWQERPVYSDDNGSAWFNAYLGDPYRRAPGHHWVYIYNENLQKIAEVEYQVMP